MNNLKEEDKIFYDDNNIKIINDNIINTDLIEENSIDLVVTSPPYNLNIDYECDDINDNMEWDDYLDFSRKWLSKVYTLIKDDGRMCLNIHLNITYGGKRIIIGDIVNIAKEIGYDYQSLIIWDKGNSCVRHVFGSWMSAQSPYISLNYECILLLSKGSWEKKSGSGISDISRNDFIKWTLGVWNFNTAKATVIGHPAPFPIELPKRCIKLFSYVDDVILDPFLGSGTTLIAAKVLNRKGIGVDINKKYCELSLERLNKEARLSDVSIFRDII